MRPAGLYARHRFWLLPAITIAGLGLIWLADNDFEVDSGLYAGVAWGMVASGDWWTPRAGDLAYFNKPPLVLWVHAAFMWATRPLFDAAGEGLPPLWVVKVPVLAQAAFAVGASAVAARRLAGPKVGLHAGLMLALSLPFILHLDRAIMDYAVVGFMMLAVAWVARGDELGSRWRLVGSGVWIGLALLCKPFFALLGVPLVMAWLGLRGRWRALPWVGLSVVVAAAVAAPWHVSMALLHGEAFTSQYLGRETVSRGLGGGGYVFEPWWSYLWYIAREFWPWNIPLALGLIEAARRTRRQGLGRSARGVSFALVWSVGWLTMLAAFGDKRPRYMMHVWPALALPASIWVARWAPTGLRGTGTKRLAWLPRGAVAAGVIAQALPILPRSPRDPRYARIAELVERMPPDVELWNGTLMPDRTGSIALTAGVWPKGFHHCPFAHGGRMPPEGDWVLWHADRLGTLGITPDAAGGHPAVIELIDDYALLRWRGGFARRLRGEVVSDEP